MHDSKFIVDITRQPLDIREPRTRGPLSPTTLEKFIEHADAGAHNWFHGVTRRTTGERITETLSYESHHSMAIKELARLCVTAIENFKLHRVVLVHRIGDVPVGQASVIVGCSAAHRIETFAALPWIMDQLKRDVPIWKRETFINGTQQWMHPTEGGS